MIDHNWVVGIRTDFLTDIFKFFPFFASDYFYITFIALGYWLNPSALLFRSLGFLIPFSTLINCLLKNLFKISRPDISLHLIPVHDPFGFPSGDVQVATVFWIMIFFSLNSCYKYLCLLPVIGIGFSRVYLGVHSIYDVVGGLLFGICTVYIWEKYLQRRLLATTLQCSYQKFGLVFIITVLLYTIVSRSLEWPPMIPMAIGTLVGFGLSLRWLIDQTVKLQNKATVSIALLSLAILIILAKFVPTLKVNKLIFYSSMIIKYAILVLGIFVLIPTIVSRIIKHKSY